ncbi:MAG: hypothetical protein IH945_00390 [Armatimonadetes bacterium]|nr:hypothetical protein [Armatimonadota bacterium]
MQQIENAVNSYLDSKEIKNILTPGEFSQWTVDMKAGQVLIADARSDAFDPALQIVFLEEGEDEEADGKVLAQNDDRFPGDQRPLLIWRCEKDGKYKVRARCFRDKSGGQFFLRMKTYESLDMNSNGPAEMEVDGSEKILLRLQMKAGDIRQVYFERPNDKEYVWGVVEITISPSGLPDIMLTSPIDRVIRDSVMAAVDGDYYVIVRPSPRREGKIRARVREISPVELQRRDGRYSDTADRNTLSLWTLDVKEGDILQVSTQGVSLSSRFVLAEQPDITEYDLDKNENNPFFPKPVDEEDDDGPVIVQLPARARDQRVGVFVVRRDATLWLASNGSSEKDGTYALSVVPASRDFVAAKVIESRLNVGYTDYWTFEAKAGDVMTFNSTATGFAEQLIVRDPDLTVAVWQSPNPDETEANWSMVIDKPGRYLVAVSAIGDGGSGAYTLDRQVFSAQEFGKSRPAQGDFSSGRAEVWKFTVTPDEPMLMHWRSSALNYSVSIRDEKGAQATLPLVVIDPRNQYAILRVVEETTYLLVLVSLGKKMDYAITLSDLPGYVNRSKASEGKKLPGA